MEAVIVGAASPAPRVYLRGLHRAAALAGPVTVASRRRGGRTMHPLRAQQAESEATASAVFPPRDSMASSVEVREWESGKSMEDIAAGQGIKIRRRPPSGTSGDNPRNILEEIIWYKDVEVAHLKERAALASLKESVENAPPARDFLGTLRESYERTGLPALIAEVKKASPSRGILQQDFDPVKIAKAYEKGGAACISVLTDQKFFQGGFENLVLIRNSGVQCPLLCKEFVIDVWQIYYARSKGADAVLLIAAVLTDLDIKYMLKICRSLDMTALVEVHDEREMDRVLAIDGIQLIGINNRNLETFEVDISNTQKLLEGERGQKIRDKGIIVVGESGLFTPVDVSYVQEAGVKAILVGESIVKQSDPAAGITELFGREVSRS